MKRWMLLLLATSTLSLQACAPLIVGGAAAGGNAAVKDETIGSQLDDATISTKIHKFYLEKDSQQLFVNVGIEVTEGRVLLTGTVTKPESRIEAVRLAWMVQGVKEVIDEIQVQDKSSLSDVALDSWITSELRARLILTKGIKSVNYSIETVNGTVYLLGIAQDQAELNRVTSVASTTKYVKKVVSHVRLKNDPKRFTSG